MVLELILYPHSWYLEFIPCVLHFFPNQQLIYHNQLFLRLELHQPRVYYYNDHHSYWHYDFIDGKAIQNQNRNSTLILSLLSNWLHDYRFLSKLDLTAFGFAWARQLCRCLNVCRIYCHPKFECYYYRVELSLIYQDHYSNRIINGWLHNVVPWVFSCSIRQLNYNFANVENKDR